MPSITKVILRLHFEQQAGFLRCVMLRITPVGTTKGGHCERGNSLFVILNVVYQPSSFRAERSAVEKSGQRAISIIPTIAQVSPVGILQSNQSNLLLATPSLDLLFSCYAGEHIAKRLKVNERIDLVATCEALDKTILVLTDSLSNIIGEANV